MVEVIPPRQRHNVRLPTATRKLHADGHKAGIPVITKRNKILRPYSATLQQNAESARGMSADAG